MGDDVMVVDCPREQRFFMILWGLEVKSAYCFQ